MNNNQLNRKNRTLQYYQFLFYSIKLEIKNVELMNLITYSCIFEILLWIFSITIIFQFNLVFNILHILHLIRGVLGLFLQLKIPKSSDIIQGMESNHNKEEMENKVFNDFTRKIIDVEVIQKSKPLKTLSLIYVIITLINIFIDFIDFLNSLTKFNSKETANTNKINLLICFCIAVLYLGNLK